MGEKSLGEKYTDEMSVGEKYVGEVKKSVGEVKSLWVKSMWLNCLG